MLLIPPTILSNTIRSIFPDVKRRDDSPESPHFPKLLGISSPSGKVAQMCYPKNLLCTSRMFTPKSVQESLNEDIKESDRIIVPPDGDIRLPPFHHLDEGDGLQ